MEIRTEVDIQHRIDGQSRMAFERRPAWRGAPGVTLELPVARAAYVRSRDHWRVSLRRADLRWHRHEPSPEVPTLQALLLLVDEDAYACFFG